MPAARLRSCAAPPPPPGPLLRPAPRGGGAGTPGGRKRPAPPGPASRVRSQTPPVKWDPGCTPDPPSSGSAPHPDAPRPLRPRRARSPSQRPPPQPDPTAPHQPATLSASPGLARSRLSRGTLPAQAPPWCRPHREGGDPPLRGDSWAGGWDWRGRAGTERPGPSLASAVGSALLGRPESRGAPHGLSSLLPLGGSGECSLPQHPHLPPLPAELDRRQTPPRPASRLLIRPFRAGSLGSSQAGDP